MVMKLKTSLTFQNQNCFKILHIQDDTYDILINVLIAVRHLWTLDPKLSKTFKTFVILSDFPHFTLYIHQSQMYTISS